MNENRSPFERSWRIAAPWNPHLLFEFRYLEKEMKEPVPMAFEEELRKALHRYLAHLIHLVDYCGLQNTWARLAQEWNQEGVPLNRAWMGAALGGELVMAGIHQGAVHIFNSKEGESCGLSPLHFWAIAESCRWMQLDLIPQCEESGGVPFGNREEIEKDLEFVGKRLSEIDEILQGEFDPYARIRSFEMD